jgi:hypothetical protein
VEEDCFGLVVKVGNSIKDAGPELQPPVALRKTQMGRPREECEFNPSVISS